MEPGKLAARTRPSVMAWRSTIFAAGVASAALSGFGWWRFAVSYPNYSVGDFLGYWGLALAIIGVLISLFGFGFGLTQLERTQGAAAAVTEAIRKVRHDYASFDLISDARAIQLLADQIQGQLSARRFVEAAPALNSLRGGLFRMSEAYVRLEPNRAEALKDLSAKAQEAFMAMSDLSDGDADVTLAVSAARRWLQDADNLMASIDIELRSRPDGE